MTSVPYFNNEWEFQRGVENLAKEHLWDEGLRWIFHIPARAYELMQKDSSRIPGGFPDLVLRRIDDEGNLSMFVAELKTETGTYERGQKEFLEDFAKFMPAFLWRPSDWEYIKEVLQYGPPETTGEIIEPSKDAQFVSKTVYIPSKRELDVTVLRLVEDICNPQRPGDSAELRRMNPEQPKTAAFYRLMGEAGLLDNPILEDKWALITHGIALMTPTAHDSRTSVGEALFEGGDPGRPNAFYSGLRLNKLLRASSSNRTTLLQQLFRMMGAANAPFDWREMAAFILSEGIDEGAAEASRRRIARSYYGTEYRNSRARAE